MINIVTRVQDSSVDWPVLLKHSIAKEIDVG
jgi:hypothetical protein